MKTERQFVLWEEDEDTAWAITRRLISVLKKRQIVGVLIGCSRNQGGWAIYAYGKPSQHDASRFLAAIVNQQV